VDDALTRRQCSDTRRSARNSTNGCRWRRS